MKKMFLDFICFIGIHFYKQNGKSESTYSWCECKQASGKCKHSEWLVDVTPVKCSRCKKESLRFEYPCP